MEGGDPRREIAPGSGSRSTSTSRTRRPLFVFVAASGRAFWKKHWCCCYDPESGNWVRLPLGLGGSRRNVTVFIASAPGLLCFAKKINSSAFGDGHQLWVCNPVSGEKKLLPPSPGGFCLRPADAFQISNICDDAPDLFQALITDPATNGFKLLLEGYYRKMEVYDSLTDSWTSTSVQVPSQIEFSLSRPVCKGILYCLAKNPTRLVSYDPIRNIWLDPAAYLNASIRKPYLFEHRDELLMVGTVSRMEVTGTEEETLCIWKLILETQNWEEVARLPQTLIQSFQKRMDLKAMHIVGEGDLLYFTSLPKASNRGINDLLVCDLSLQSWYWAPKCVLRLKKIFRRRRLGTPVWRTMYGVPNMLALTCEAP